MYTAVILDEVSHNRIISLEDFAQQTGSHEIPSLVEIEVEIPMTNNVGTRLIDTVDQIPEVMPVSDDSDDAHNVEMTLAAHEEDDNGTSLQPLQQLPARAGSRRVRVEDDDEDENNRRRSSPRLVPTHTSPQALPSTQPLSSHVYIQTQPSRERSGASVNSFASDRPSRPLPRNVPSPLRHHHIPFGTGLVPAIAPFDLRSMFDRVFRATPNETESTQSDNTGNQTASSTRSSADANAPVAIPITDLGQQHQNHFTDRTAARALLSFSSGPAHGLPHQHSPRTPYPGVIDFTLGFFQNGPGAGPQRDVTNSQVHQHSNESSRWRPPPDFLEALIRTMFHDGFGSGAEGLEKENPERASKLLSGLEEVPIGLIKRMDRLCNIFPSHQDVSNGGDANCAVCWESLLSINANEVSSSLTEGNTSHYLYGLNSSDILIF